MTIMFSLLFSMHVYRTSRLDDTDPMKNAIEFNLGKGYFAECGLRNAESCQRVICGRFDADFFCRMKGKVRNESMRNVTEMNIY